MNNYEKIEALVEQNNGFLRVKDLEANNIHRQYLKIMEEKGILIKTYSGIGCLGTCLRVTTGEKDIMQKFIEALLDLDK